MKHTIYCFYDPRVEPVTVRYVGYTTKTIEKRLYEHLKEAETSKTNVHRLNWFRSLIKDGIKPVFIELEKVNETNWQERERHWINHFGRENLVNSTDGGEGSLNPSQETREKIGRSSSERMKGKQHLLGYKHTDKSKALISQRTRERYANRTEEERLRKAEKIRAQKLGVKRKPFSDKTRKNMSEAHKGQKLSEERKKKLDWTGKKHTEETKLKQSLAKKGKAPNHSTKGTRHIHNGEKAMLLKQNDPLPEGWVYGMLKRTQEAQNG